VVGSVLCIDIVDESGTESVVEFVLRYVGFARDISERD